MARRTTLRASDADREHVAERLRQATAEGRLLAHELEHRLGAALKARTYGELDDLVADLPREGRPVHRPTDSAARARRQRSHMTRLRSVPPLALVVLLPVLFSLVLVVVLVVASLAFVWAILVALSWWVFGSRSGLYRTRVMAPIHAGQRIRDGRPGSWF